MNPEVYTEALLMLPMALNCSHAASNMSVVNLFTYDIQLCLLRRHLRHGLPKPTFKLTTWHGVITKTLIDTIIKKSPNFMDYHGSH